MPELRQFAGNAVARDQSQTCLVSLEQPTLAGSLVIVVGVAVHSSYGYYPLGGPEGFTKAFERIEDELTVEVWYRENCPPITGVGMYSPGERSLQVRVHEYTGVSQFGALDRVKSGGDNDEFSSGSRYPQSGSTATTSQADELIFGVIANRYGSTQQYGFTGGMQKLSDSLSPDRWGSGRRESDDDRTRVTTHQAFQTATGTWSLGCTLSTLRDWVSVVLTFRGGATGPARMTSTTAPRIMSFGGSGALTVFGPLRSTGAGPVMGFGGAGRIGPFEQQVRLGGWDGLLLGPNTPYNIEKISGLDGWDLRVNDTDLSRGAGAQRGTDLQAVRLVAVDLNFDDPDPAVLETLAQQLRAALRPRPDEDFDLLFRKIGGPLQVLRCRPVMVPGEMDLLVRMQRKQSFALRAADPRVYSARERELVVPVTPAGSETPAAVIAPNDGTERAYPVMTFENRGSVPVTGLQLTNSTGFIIFELSGAIAPGSTLTADMVARIRQTGDSPITLDGQSLYGMWQSPRSPFFLAPAPDAPDGANAVHLSTTPAGAQLVCTLRYRDTWHG